MPPRLLGVEDALEEAPFRDAYERHNRAVVEYFRDQPGRLVVVDLTTPNATNPWDTLCAFFQIPAAACPRGKLPHRHDAKKKSVCLGTRDASRPANASVPAGHAMHHLERSGRRPPLPEDARPGAPAGERVAATRRAPS